MIAGAALSSSVPLAGAETEALGIPGPYRGKVIAVNHAKCIRRDAYQAEPIRAMVQRGMCELTGEAQAADAWRRFFAPSDVVGIKMSPVGRPFVCSSKEMLGAIIEGLQSAGVKPGNIVVYERYREILESAGIPQWVPDAVRVESAAPAYTAEQQDRENYDAEHYVEFPFVLPGSDPKSEIARRSYFTKFLTQHVNKVINVPCLKTHELAGVTLALKNLSHGLVNNVSRSHDGPKLLYTEFIPGVVGSPLVRSKTVLNILDGTRGLFHGGPGIMAGLSQSYVWDHKTAYFATDPVALDRMGMIVLEAMRKKQHLKPIHEAKPDSLWPGPVRQPEYIDSAGQAGLGEADASKIAFQRIELA